jgi:hypothetical protein
MKNLITISIQDLQPLILKAHKHSVSEVVAHMSGRTLIMKDHASQK